METERKAISINSSSAQGDANIASVADVAHVDAFVGVDGKCLSSSYPIPVQKVRIATEGKAASTNPSTAPGDANIASVADIANIDSLSRNANIAIAIDRKPPASCLWILDRIRLASQRGSSN